MNLYKVCITIKEVSPYFFACFKAFLVCRGEDEIVIFGNVVLFYEDINSRERQQFDCLICLNIEKSM